jgi:cytochrome c oxidase subunit IV
MTYRTIAPRTYVLIGVLLILLTFLTVGLSFLHVPPIWHLVLGLTIAGIKASLVVLFFMHALVSPRLIWIVIVVAGFWFGLMLVLTLTDYLTRGAVPFMPGH